jgi:hypothetical protein
MIEQLAKILNISADVLYFCGKRVPADVFDDGAIETAFRAFSSRD